jgi:hypothetical protein
MGQADGYFQYRIVLALWINGVDNINPYPNVSCKHCTCNDADNPVSLHNICELYDKIRMLREKQMTRIRV